MDLPFFLSPLLIASRIQAAIAKIFCTPDPDLISAIRVALESETDPLPKDILSDIISNATLAGRDKIPTCQDTGSLVVFVEYGTAIHLGGADLTQVISQAATSAWQDLCLRDSIVGDPLLCRAVQSDPLPVIIHSEVVPGNILRVSLALKGGGAENMSVLRMFSPGASVTAIQDFVVDAAVSAKGLPCPPLILGVGIGGNFETCALLAKKALFRPLGQPHPLPAYAALEMDILADLNARGCGPMGMGGNTTALAVHILCAPCHIASLPVAVNIQCHSHRHSSFELVGV